MIANYPEAPCYCHVVSWILGIIVFIGFMIWFYSDEVYDARQEFMRDMWAKVRGWFKVD